ncbi:NfeD family protein [Gallaecimonas sp. GXIMD1310]|uniref:NfeD family protein n=1 Tax=Gallaecimonas sp. GXIMD1310 TaxID=3131926 RepID=UPI00325694CB
MEPWLYWLIGALVLFIAEAFTATAIALALGACALSASLVAYAGLPFGWQTGGFVFTAFLLSPLVVRRYQRRHHTTGQTLGEAGFNAVGMVRLGSDGVARVHIDGKDFPLKSASQQSLKEGQVVAIRRFEGITAIVD